MFYKRSPAQIAFMHNIVYLPLNKLRELVDNKAANFNLLVFGSLTTKHANVNQHTK
jgi:hypothetical protein